jgi:hypothetical protein
LRRGADQVCEFGLVGGELGEFGVEIAAEVAVEVAALADLPASLEERAAAILDSLRRVIPFQAARIALLDPEVRRHDLLSCHGYNDHSQQAGGVRGAAALTAVHLPAS